MSKPKFVAGYEAALELVESLLALMEQRGVSRAELARLANVERSTVTKWLTPGRNLTVFTAAMIADTLDADLEICAKDRRFTHCVDEFTMNPKPEATVKLQGNLWDGTPSCGSAPALTTRALPQVRHVRSGADRQRAVLG